jgi:uncharacterized protein with PQ loop repeat
MEANQIQIIAGSVSTLMFVSSNFPMLYKAYKTKDMKSYNLGNMAMSNLANLIYWVYVSSLPFGPVWFLHGFNTLVTLMMFVWYWQYEVGCKVTELSVNCVTNLNECVDA